MTSPPVREPGAIDRAFGRTQTGDHDAFAAWVRSVELPLRAGLRSFARSVDVEAVLQEGLMRMWLLAPRLRLEGENASLRYAHRLVRNLALHEARRNGRLEALPPEPEAAPAIDPEPPSDPAVIRAIRECLSRLAGQPRRALIARLESGGEEPDKALAAGVGMTLNTFLQNVVRARRSLAQCLDSHGVSSQGYAS